MGQADSRALLVEAYSDAFFRERHTRGVVADDTNPDRSQDPVAPPAIQFSGHFSFI